MIKKKEITVRILILIVVFFYCGKIDAQSLKETALLKISELELLISQAESNNIDITREEATLWFANTFITFADWDENNLNIYEILFNQFWPYKNAKKQLALDLPDFEREEVINMIEASLKEFKTVLSGNIIRKSTPKIDWENITIKGDHLQNDGKPVFLYDYFSKTPDFVVGEPSLFNDYLGAIYHPWNINPSYCTKDYTMQPWQFNNHISSNDKNIGYTMLWHSQAPNWVKDIDPEVEKGRSIFIGYDIDNPIMLKIWDTILFQVGKSVINKNFNKLSFCLVNEPHWFSEEDHWTASAGEMQSISTHTLDKFKTWLTITHNNNINNLNEIWDKNFLSFDEVQIKIPIAKEKHGTPEYYDWCRFNMDRGTEWITSLHSSLKRGYPNARTHVKIMPNLFTEEPRHHGVDLEAITDLTEFIGDDAKTRKLNNTGAGSKEWSENYAYFWEELAVSYDFMESVSPNKPHINSEVHFLSTSHFRDLEMKPEYVRNSYWLATLHGMDVGLTWLWSRHPDGRIENAVINGGGGRDGGYPGSVNQQPRVANELTRTMMDLNAFSEEIYKLRSVRKPIRIFFTETSAINKKAHMNDLFELYESLYFNGLSIGYATQNIIRKQDINNWDVVVVYKTEFVTKEEFNSLQEYLNKGGTIIIDDGRSLIKNEYGHTRRTTLIAGKGNLIKMGSNVSFDSMKTKALSVSMNKGQYPKVELNEVNNLSKRGCMWRVVNNNNGTYLVNAVNLGKNKTILRPKIKGSKYKTSCTNLMTGEEMGDRIELEPERVLLLNVRDSLEKL